MRVFALHGGVALATDLEAAGITRGLIRQRVATGEWKRVAHGVVALAGLSASWDRAARVAVLRGRPHAALSHASAARVHGFDGYAADERLVVTGIDGWKLPTVVGVQVHRSDMVRASDCVDVDGLRCVMRPVALIQVAATDGRDAAAQALDSMLRHSDSPVWIRKVALAWQRGGVRGPAIVLDLLNERVDTRLPRSWFQRLTKRALAECGIELVDEYPVHDADGRLLAELDLAIPELMIGVECQSWRWHSSPSARAHDAARKRRLRLLGWELVEVWWSDLDQLDEVLAELVLLINSRRPRARPIHGR
ncbi:MAG: type IV toxin-antitoxin system AbiEi family antitoxin domain-containing protein [Actinomycetota bacterium]